MVVEHSRRSSELIIEPYAQGMPGELATIAQEESDEDQTASILQGNMSSNVSSASNETAEPITPSISQSNSNHNAIAMKKSKSIRRSLSAGLARLSRTMSAPTRLVRTLSNREMDLMKEETPSELMEQVPLSRRLSQRASVAMTRASRSSRRALSRVKPSKGFTSVTSVSMSMAYSPFHMQYSTNYPGYAKVPTF
ncbi:hypothetical protein BDF22DRAFT_673148, partial [Syncephalis plumigaleata]